MDTFNMKLNGLSESFSSLQSRNEREEAVEAVGETLRRMADSLVNEEVLTEEATRLIQEEYGDCIPSSSFAPFQVEGDILNDFGLDDIDLLDEEEVFEEEDYGDAPISLVNLSLQQRQDSLRPQSDPLICGELEEKWMNGWEDDGRKRKMNAEWDEETKKKKVDFSMNTVNEFEGADQEKEKGMRKCAECDFIAGNRKALWRHTKSSGHSSQRGKGTFKCSECSFETITSFNLQRHKNRKHSSIPKIECPECRRPFNDHSSLSSHYSHIHTGSSLFRCPSPCSRTFSSDSNLRRHQRIAHEGFIVHDCPCGKSFQSGWHLKRHEEVCTLLVNR